MARDNTVVPIGRPKNWRRQLEQSQTVEDLLGPFEVHLRSLGRSARTIERYTSAARKLSYFLGDPGVGEITREDIEKWLAYLRDHAAASSIASYHVALAQFFKYAALDTGRNPMAGMTAPNYEPPTIDVPPLELLATLVARAERGRSYEDLRDTALLRVFIDTGARLSEITDLTVDDLLPGDKLRLMGKSRGKGKVERHVPIGEKAARALKRYVKVRAAHPDASAPNLWLGMHGPMTFSGIRQVIYRRSKAAGQKIHPHQFRHAFAHGWKSDPSRKDEDLMYLAGWRSDVMLRRYGRAAGADRAIEAYRHHGAPGDNL